MCRQNSDRSAVHYPTRRAGLVTTRKEGASVVYAGFILLAATLASVFLFAHQRVWARIEPRGANEFEVTIGGNTNRNKLGFEDRFRKLLEAITQ